MGNFSPSQNNAKTIAASEETARIEPKLQPKNISDKAFESEPLSCGFEISKKDKEKDRKISPAFSFGGKLTQQAFPFCCESENATASQSSLNYVLDLRENFALHRHLTSSLEETANHVKITLKSFFVMPDSTSYWGVRY